MARLLHFSGHQSEKGLRVGVLGPGVKTHVESAHETRQAHGSNVIVQEPCSNVFEKNTAVGKKGLIRVDLRGRMRPVI